MRRAAQIDENQPEIVKALRDAGCSVEPIHRHGQGIPDLLVGFRRQNLLLEVKDGNKPPSRRVLTPDEALWHLRWRGQVEVVETIEQALRAVGLEVAR